MIPDYEKITEHIMLSFFFWGGATMAGVLSAGVGASKRRSKRKVTDKMKRVGGGGERVACDSLRKRHPLWGSGLFPAGGGEAGGQCGTAGAKRCVYAAKVLRTRSPSRLLRLSRPSAASLWRDAPVRTCPRRARGAGSAPVLRARRSGNSGTRARAGERLPGGTGFRLPRWPPHSRGPAGAGRIPPGAGKIPVMGYSFPLTCNSWHRTMNPPHSA